MFLLFVLPFDVRNDPYYLEWVVYRALYKNPSLGLLTPPNYWEDIDSRIKSGAWGTLQPITRHFQYSLPSQLDLDRCAKFPLEFGVLDELQREVIGPGQVWSTTMLENVPALHAQISKALEHATGIEAIFLWNNCISLKDYALAKGIPTIHCEVGPLRPPHFRFTAYFDNEGVNGQTDAERRWRTFLDENPKVPILTREALVNLLSIDQTPSSATVSHDVGVALQVPDDSNLIAFSRGFDTFGLITTSLRYLPGRPLIRSHPGRTVKFSDLPVDWDESPHPRAFLDRVESLVTINSSLAFEAMLLGKPTYVLGDSPARVGSWNIGTRSPKLSEAEMLLWLNWFVFGYLIPFDSTFDPTYCRWRLTKPSEREIYLDNFHKWTIGSKHVI